MFLVLIWAMTTTEKELSNSPNQIHIRGAQIFPPFFYKPVSP